MSVGPRPPSAVRALNRGRLTPFSLRITPRRVAGRGGRSSSRTAPCTFGALNRGRLPSCSAGLRPSGLQATLSAAFLSPFLPRAQRPRATFPCAKLAAFGTLPGPSRLLFGPALRCLEVLLPETKRFARRPLEQAALEGRERDDACRAACGTRQFFPKTDRARARSELGESQRGCRRGLEGGAPWGG